MTRLSGSRMVMMMRGRIHRHMRPGLVVSALFLMVSRAGWCAQHRRPHRAADGEQDGKQYQEPDTKRFHSGQISTVTVHECRHRV